MPTPAERLASLRSLDPVALKWRSLIERRRAHFVDLYLSGRWKRYFSEEQFLTNFREAMSMADRWTEIAPKPGDRNLTQPELTREALSGEPNPSAFLLPDNQRQ